MAILLDAVGNGVSGAFWGGKQDWSHPSSGDDRAIVVWGVSYHSSRDIVTGATTTMFHNGTPMTSKGKIIFNKHLFLECFVLQGQDTGSNTIDYKHDGPNTPWIYRATSISYTGVTSIGNLVNNIGNGDEAAIQISSTAGEVILLGIAPVGQNVDDASGSIYFVKGNVTPRFAIFEEDGATTVDATAFLHGATDWAIGAISLSPVTAGPNTWNADIGVQFDVDIDHDATIAGAIEADFNVSVPVSISHNASVDLPPQPISHLSLGGHMSPVKGMYPSSDIDTNVLQSSAPSAYSGQVVHTTQDVPARFRVGGNLVAMEGFWWNNINGNEITGSNQVAGMTSYEIEFWCAGTDLTLVLRNEPGTSGYGNSDYLIVVDDMIMPPSTGVSNVADIQNGWNHFPGSTAVRYHVLKFKENKVRRIRLMLGIGSLVEVRIPGSADIWPAPRRFKAAFTSDSWGHASLNGIEGEIVAGTIPGELALATGWEVWNLSQGGTGYINDGASGGTSKFGSTDRLNALAALPPLDCVIVLGGGNDVNQSHSAVATAADTFWTAIKTARPDTPLVVVGVQSPELFASDGLEALNDVIRAAAATAKSNGIVDMFVDMWEPEQWISGDSGNLSNRDGSGSRDLFITLEPFGIALHPTHAGARNVAERLARSLRGSLH